MTKVIGVRFRTAGKIYFFSPGEFEIKQGDHVIVETARGIEYGRVVSAPKEVDDDSVVQPLKSVIRIATEQDEKTVEKNRQKEKEAFKICQEKIRKHGLDMKLIEAEALGRDNLATGKQKLEEFVRQYRDPSYTCTAGSLDAFIDEVWFQRRIELWGEGFALFDILRLKKPIIRQGANYPINSTFAEIAAEAPIMIYRIPEAETSVNSAITEADNNPAAMAPTPVN